MTYNSNYLCASIPWKVTKPMFLNTEACYLKPRSVSIITVQAPTELKPQNIYKLTTSEDLLGWLIPLAAEHKVNHKYPKLLSICVLNTSYDRVYVPRLMVFGMLKPLDTENAQTNKVFWIKIERLNEVDAINGLQELCQYSQTNNELPTIPQQPCFQPEPDNMSKQLVIVEDAQVPQEPRDQLFSLLQDKFDSIMSKSPTDVGPSYGMQAICTGLYSKHAVPYTRAKSSSCRHVLLYLVPP